MNDRYTIVIQLVDGQPTYFEVHDTQSDTFEPIASYTEFAQAEEHASRLNAAEDQK